MTWTGLLWEPGQKVLANGFAPFWLAAVAAGCALLAVAEIRARCDIEAYIPLFTPFLAPWRKLASRV